MSITEVQVGWKYFEYEFGKENKKRIYSGPDIKWLDYSGISMAVPRRIRQSTRQLIKSARKAVARRKTQRKIREQLNNLTGQCWLAESEGQRYGR